MINKLFTLINILFIILTPILLEKYIYHNEENLILYSTVHILFVFIFYVLSYFIIKYINNIYVCKNGNLLDDKYYTIDNILLSTNIVNFIIYTTVITFYIINKEYDIVLINNNIIIIWELYICNFLFYYSLIYMQYEYFAYIRRINNIFILVSDILLYISCLGTYNIILFINKRKGDIRFIFINVIIWIILNFSIYINCYYYINFKYSLIPVSIIPTILLHFKIIDYNICILILCIIILLFFILYKFFKYKYYYY